jgi:phage terminase large subunit
VVEILIPEILMPAYENKSRYKSIFGGRGSSKSWTVAAIMLLKAMSGKVRILCVREIQKSIKDSVHKLLSDLIEMHEIGNRFTITKDGIKENITGSEFIFTGLYRNQNQLKSMEGVNYCWVEEAHSVSNESLDILIPTIRQPESEIWFTYNRQTTDDPVHKRFVEANRDDTIVVNVNHDDNPFFPEVLRHEMEWDRANDVDKYMHIWKGEPLKHSEAQVFYGKWSIEHFDTPEGMVFYFGADWGFSKDPTTLIRCFIAEGCLYIDYETWGVGVDIVDIPELFKNVPDSTVNIITADSARPETISHVRANGYPYIKRSKKGKGSIEDGISFIRSFKKIIIHPRCKHAIDEFKCYSYKVDKLTGDPTVIIEDKNNHIVDALRYAIEAIMKKNKSMARASRISAGELGV